MSELVREVTDSSFAIEVLQSSQPVLVDFWAPRCSSCHQLEPIVNAVAAKYKGVARVVKVNVDDNFSTAQQYGINCIPTLILFQSGKAAERIIGDASEAGISALIDRNSGKFVGA